MKKYMSNLVKITLVIALLTPFAVSAAQIANEESKDVNIQVALIALCSAVAGALITAVSNYLISRKLESDKRIKEKQKEIYSDFFEKLQIFKNYTDSITFESLQHIVNKVCLYGDNETSLCVKDYFEVLILLAQKKYSLQEAEITSHETKIMNAMRKSLGLRTFNKFSLIRFTPN